MRKIFCFAMMLSVVFSVTIMLQARAADLTFDNGGGAGDNDWALGTNWMGGTVAGTDDNAFITADVASISSGVASVYSADFTDAKWSSNFFNRLTLTVTTMATFNGVSNNGPGTINGNVTFKDTSTNLGTINGDVEFNDDSSSFGTINGNVTLRYSSHTVGGTINGDVEFNDTSHNSSVTINGDAEFNDDSYNTGTINGKATFNGSSYNNSGFFGGGIINGSVVFNSTADQSGTINAGALGTVTGDFSTSAGITFQSGTVLSVISGTGGVTKTGSGTATLSGANTYEGATTVNSGTLVIAASTGSLNAGSVLTFGGAGTFNYDNTGSDGARSQSLGDLTFSAAGQGTVQTTRVALQDVTLTFASLTAHTAGVTGNFVVSGGTNGTDNMIIFTAAPTAGELIDRGFFFGGSGYAAYDAVGAGYVRGLAYGTDTNAPAAIAAGATLGIDDITKNVKIIGAISAQTAAAVNTLNIAGAYNVTLADNQILTVNGILKGGNNTAVISGGTGIQADADTELVIRTDLVNDALIISTPVLANGASALTKSGAGTLTLSGDNTYTGATTINAGTLQIGSGGDTGSVAGDIANDAALVFNRSNDLIFSNVISGTGTFTKSGSGILTLTGANTYTGLTTVAQGELDLNGTPGFSGGHTIVGNITVSGGTLKWLANEQIAFGPAASSAVLITSGGTVDLNGMHQTGESLTNNGGVFVTSVNGWWINGNPTTVTWSGGTNTINDGGMVEDMHVIISGGTNTVEGGVTGGVLQTGGIGLEMTGATLTLNSSADIAGKLLLSGNLISNASSITSHINNGGTLANPGNIELGGLSPTPGMVVTGMAVGDFFDDFVSTSTFTIADGTTASGIDMAISAVITDGTLSDGALIKAGAGTVLFSGANTYSGGTTINAGTLAVANASALGTGPVTNNATLDVGTYALNIGDTYAQNPGSTLGVTVSSASSAGKLFYTTGAGTTINAVSTVAVRKPDTIYVPSTREFTVIEGEDGAISVPRTITSSSRRVRFAGSSPALSGDLILTADRSLGGFASDAANSNESAVGKVLDIELTPTSDMTTILNTMEGLSPSQTASALNSVLPDTSGAALQVTQATLDQLTGAVLGHQESLRNSSTGVSTGSDMLKGLDVWAQGFGSYLHQDHRQLSNGYNAFVWGTALGFDIPAINDLRVGTCFGFAQDYVRGKDNSNRNDINAYQWTVYGEYAKDAYYIDLSGSFAFNTYDASRQVIGRTASSDYNGEQYQVYTEAGYTLNLGELIHNGRSPLRVTYKALSNLNLTPLVSFQYQHLYLDKYTESGAGALNLTVKAQNYDLAQTGFGVKLDYPLNTNYGQLVPELRFKWLYDWVGDAQVNTSTFTGGGGSFATNGFNPAQSSWDFGAKLTMFTKNNWTCAVNYDLELKDDFYGHYGYVNAKYSF